MGSTSGKAYVPTDFSANQTRFSLPLDNYVVDPFESEFAVNLLVQQCMRSAGLKWNIPPNSASALPPTRNRVGRRLFNRELAAKYGYHSGPAQLPPSGQLNPVLTATQQPAFDKCAADANKRVGVDRQLRDLVESLQLAAYQAVKASPKFTATTNEWKRCMTKAGFTDLTNFPDVMPSDAQRRDFGLATQADQVVSSIGSPSEIKQATIDADCRESSGYANFMYSTEVDNQLRLMSQNADAMERARAARAAAMATIQAVLRGHA